MILKKSMPWEGGLRPPEKVLLEKVSVVAKNGELAERRRDCRVPVFLHALLKA